MYTYQHDDDDSTDDSLSAYCNVDDLVAGVVDASN
jgi:hypothetical protein